MPILAFRLSLRPRERPIKAGYRMSRNRNCCIWPKPIENLSASSAGHPSTRAKAKSAAQNENPTEFDGIVWEALRFVPISPFMFRQAASDYTVAKGTDHATTIKTGTYILPVTQSAMFDPKAFENPDRFIPGRNWYHYFHFGFGSHECLGKYVGMVMIPEMVRQALLRPGLKANGSIDYQGGHLPQRYDLSWG